MELCRCSQLVAQVLILTLCIIDSFTRAANLTATCNVVTNTAIASGINDAVTGTVTFTQDESGGNTTIVISLTGFDTSDSYTEHGFHVHSSNNMTVGCNSMGGHYNPTSVNHSAPTSAVRHVGDLGNIQENGQGEVSLTIIDHIVSLIGDHSVINRGIVIHQQKDDLGLGGDAGSLASGNAGPRLACCVILSSGNGSGVTSFSTHVLLASTLLCILPKIFL